MTEKDLKSITKVQLVEILEDKKAKIEELSNEKTKIKFNMQREIDKVNEQKSTITKFYELQHIENISDLKSVRDMLQPFKDDVMTHREKKYLAEKFTKILSNKIMNKVDTMHRLSTFDNYDDDLPF